MFDEIVKLVKEQLGGNSQAASSIPADQADAVHNEIAGHITNGLAGQAEEQGGIGGLLSKLQSGLSSGSPITNAISGGLVSSLASKFGLPPAATGAIAGMLPGLLQKFAHKANDPNDPSITPDNIQDTLSNKSGGILGSLGGLFK